MEDTILGIFKDLITDGSLNTESLLVILIAAIAVVSYYIIRPMYLKIKTLVTKEEIQEILEKKVGDETKEIERFIEERVKDEFRQLKELEDLLRHLVEKVDSDEEIGRSNHKEIKELRRDIESMKQILNQFQGHMMYGRRSSDFSNQEIR